MIYINQGIQTSILPICDPDFHHGRIMIMVIASIYNISTMERLYSII